MKEKKYYHEGVLLKEWYDSQPFNKREGIKKLIADKCYVSIYTVENWLFQRASINVLFQREINDLAQETIFEVKSINEESHV